MGLSYQVDNNKTTLRKETGEKKPPEGKKLPGRKKLITHPCKSSSEDSNSCLVYSAIDHTYLSKGVEGTGMNSVEQYSKHFTYIV
jgi:hypothetical protein